MPETLWSAGLSELPAGAHVGTGSLRRMAQIRAARPDLVVQGIRGNVDTRLRKLDEGQFDAIVLAAAGLKRLGWSDRITEFLSVDVMCPAVGQGSRAQWRLAITAARHAGLSSTESPPTQAASRQSARCWRCLAEAVRYRSALTPSSTKVRYICAQSSSARMASVL